MSDTVVFIVFATILPWLAGWLLLLRFKPATAAQEGGAPPTDDEVDACRKWTQVHTMWWLVLLLSLPPYFIWTDDTRRDTVEAISGVLTETGTRITSTIAYATRFVVPFAVFPIIIFGLKLLTSHRSTKEECAGWHKTKGAISLTSRQQRQQSQLITFTIRVLVMIFVFFGVLNQVGVETGEILEITTVFSLGVSWSMRDWLSSLWACFMIAFTTELTCDTAIRVGLDQKDAPWLTVVRPGLLYTVCQCNSIDETTCHIYIPNSTLLTSGFNIKRQKP